MMDCGHNSREFVTICIQCRNTANAEILALRAENARLVEIVKLAKGLSAAAVELASQVGCETDAPGDSTCEDVGRDLCAACEVWKADEVFDAALARGRETPNV